MNFDIAIQLIGSVFMNLILTMIIIQKVHLNFTDNVAKITRELQLGYNYVNCYCQNNKTKMLKTKPLSILL